MSKSKKLPSSGGLVEIELPLEGTSTKINVNATTTVKQVHDIIIQRNFYENTSYAFSLVASSARKNILSPDTLIVKVNDSKFTLIISGIITNIRIEYNNCNQIFQFGSDFTVKECLQFIEENNCIGAKYSKNLNLKKKKINSLHDLYLIKNANEKSSSNEGERMHHDKLLSSYRLKFGDCLVFSRSRSISNFWIQPSSNNDVTLEIVNPNRNITSKLTFGLDTTIFSIIDKFLQVNNIFESKWFYGLYFIKDKQTYYLHNNWTLRTFVLTSDDSLIIKQRNRPKCTWHGVEPTLLPHAKDPDNGISVPQILLILKDFLIKNNGYKSEGIFRKAGLESEMKTIKTHLDEGTPFVCDDQHTIATLLKRWYKALPVRLLANVDRSDESTEFALKYHTYLSKSDTNLTSWLFDLLINVVKYQDINLMDPKNCAIVWGPGLVGSADDSALTGSATDLGAMQGFSDTRFGINFITANLTHFMENNATPRGISNIKSGTSAICCIDHSKDRPGEIALKKGDKVIIQDDNNPDWSFIKHNDKYGFVAKQYIKIEK